jgi:hypothetical protein
VLIERIVDADACGRMGFSELDYWAGRAIAMRKRRK